jgi:peptide/nickel transport system substrate-binding protein
MYRIGHERNGESVRQDQPHESGALTRRNFLLASGATVLSLPALAACGSSSSTSSSASVAGKPKYGGHLKVAMADGGPSDTLDPNAGATSTDWARFTALYDRLIEQAPDGSSVPALAESFEPNSDGTVWTVKLRPGVKWHDGKPLTADDVLYTINRIGAVNSTFDGKSGVDVIDLKSMKKINTLTIQLPLKTPIADLTTAFTQYYMSIVQNGATDFKTHPVGTGPFTYVSFNPGQSISLFKRNPDYWKHGLPYVDQLTIESITDSSTRLNALLGGQVDAISQLDFATAKQQQSAKSINLLISSPDNFVPITMAVDTAPFNDVRVRQAMRLIADRPALVESAQLGFGSIGNDLSGKGFPMYNDQLPQRVQDIDQAKSLLKQAGQSGLTVTLNTSSVAAGMYESALAFAQQAKAAGVKVNLNNIPASNYFTTNYLKYTFGQSIWTAYPLDQFFTDALVADAPFNETHWNDAAWNKLFNEARGDTNAASREQKYFSLQKTLYDEGGYLIWGFEPLIDGVATNVHPAPQNPAGFLGNYEFRDYWFD